MDAAGAGAGGGGGGGRRRNGFGSADNVRGVQLRGSDLMCGCVDAGGAVVEEEDGISAGCLRGRPLRLFSEGSEEETCAHLEPVRTISLSTWPTTACSCRGEWRVVPGKEEAAAAAGGGGGEEEELINEKDCVAWWTCCGKFGCNGKRGTANIRDSPALNAIEAGSCGGEDEDETELSTLDCEEGNETMLASALDDENDAGGSYNACSCVELDDVSE